MEFLSNKHEIMVVSLESRAAKLFDFSLGQNGAISSGNWWLFHLKDHEVKVYFCPFTRLRPKTTAYFIFQYLSSRPGVLATKQDIQMARSHLGSRLFQMQLWTGLVAQIWIFIFAEFLFGSRSRWRVNLYIPTYDHRGLANTVGTKRK